MSFNKYNHNNFRKKEYEDEIEEFTININSKDRDTVKFPNPFYFRTTFRKNTVIQNVNKKTDANIQADYKDIKRVDLREIMCPRYIPTNHPGKKINHITLIRDTDSKNTVIPFPGYSTSGDGTNISLQDPTGTEKVILSDNNIIYLLDSNNTSYYGIVSVINTTCNITISSSAPSGKYTLYNLSTSKSILNSSINSINSINQSNIGTLPLGGFLLFFKASSIEYEVRKITSITDNDNVVTESLANNATGITGAELSYVGFSTLDLGEEKLITVKINELNFPKETGTNQIQSDAIGTLFPTMISDTNVCYTGICDINYNFRNLNKFNILTIGLYDKNSNLFSDGVFTKNTTHDDYFKDYDKFQVNYVFSVYEISRNF